MSSAEDVVAAALEAGQAHALVASKAAAGVLLRWPLLFLAGLLSTRRGCRRGRVLLGGLYGRRNVRLRFIGRHRLRCWAGRWQHRACWLPNIHPRGVQGRCRCLAICCCSLILRHAFPVALGTHIHAGRVPICRSPAGVVSATASVRFAHHHKAPL